MQSAMPVSPVEPLSQVSGRTQTDPDSAVLIGGSAVYVWLEGAVDAPASTVMVQLRTISGDILNTGPAIEIALDRVATDVVVLPLEQGGFALLWMSMDRSSDDPAGREAAMQLFSSDGDAIGAQVAIVSPDAGVISDVDVANLVGGDIAVTWSAIPAGSTDGIATQVWAQVFSPDLVAREDPRSIASGNPVSAPEIAGYGAETWQPTGYAVAHVETDQDRGDDFLTVTRIQDGTADPIEFQWTRDEDWSDPALTQRNAWFLGATAFSGDRVGYELGLYYNYGSGPGNIYRTSENGAGGRILYTDLEATTGPLGTSMVTFLRSVNGPTPRYELYAQQHDGFALGTFYSTRSRLAVLDLDGPPVDGMVSAHRTAYDQLQMTWVQPSEDGVTELVTATFSPITPGGADFPVVQRFYGGVPDGYTSVSYAQTETRVYADLANARPNGDLADIVDDRFGPVDSFEQIVDLEGSRWADILRGDGLDNNLDGGLRSDRIHGGGGWDNIDGGGGADALYGGPDRDFMSGGPGEGVRDRFIYLAMQDTGVGAGNRDVIGDFHPGEDRIELWRIDADITRQRNQRFDFVANDPFTGTPGELRYEHAGGRTIVMGDVDGDGAADFEIELRGVMDLTADDFLL